MDFSKVVLTRSEIVFLKRLEKRSLNEMHIDQVPKHLKEIGFVDYFPAPKIKDGQVLVKITDSGSRYLLNRKTERKSTRRNTRRYWITTTIAIIALIKAFLPEISSAAAWLWRRLMR